MRSRIRQEQRAILGLALAAAVFALTNMSGMAKEDEEKNENEVTVTAESIPPAAKAALQAELKGATPTKYEKGTKDGKTYYEAEVKSGDGELEVQVSEEGKLLSSKQEKEGEDEDEQTVTLDQLPKAARLAIERELGKDHADEITSETKDGKTHFEALVLKPGRKTEIKVSAEGKPLPFKKKGDKHHEGKGEEHHEDKD